LVQSVHLDFEPPLLLPDPLVLGLLLLELDNFVSEVSSTPKRRLTPGMNCDQTAGIQGQAAIAQRRKLLTVKS
jgi:hypothetical protein